MHRATRLADPAARHHPHDVGTADHADDAALTQNRHALVVVAGQQLRHFVDWRLFADADHAARHDVGDGAAALADEIRLAEQPNHHATGIHHRNATDVIVGEKTGGFL